MGVLVSWTKATEDEESPQVSLSFSVGLVLYSILFPCFYCYFFLPEKTIFSFHALLKGTFTGA